MELSGVTGSPALLSELLKSSAAQTTDLAEKLIRLNVENTIDENQQETLGNLIDLYV